MAALTDAQLVYLHDQLGDAADEGEMQDRYDRTNDVKVVVAEMLQRRLANLLADPASFSVSGEYTQNTSENIKAAQAQLAALSSETGSVAGVSLVRVVSPASPSDR